MKEQLYTIPLMDAFRAEDECPFCYIERDVEQNALDFVLGRDASYMQDHVRAETDRIGFCREHYEKMFNYGETLANALILETRIKYLMKEMKAEMKKCSGSSKVSLKDKILKEPSAVRGNNNVSRWVHEKESSCYICDHVKRNYDRYVATFFYLYKKDKDFHELYLNSKGFCLHHFRDLIEAAENKLTDEEKKEFYPTTFKLMQENLERLQKEVEWFVEKNDYRNKDKDWGTSADSIQRAMQKCNGGYPADPIFKAKL